MNKILADGRWSGANGIGRFSKEVLTQLQNADILQIGPKPLSIKNLFWQSEQLKTQSKYKVYFTPGFNPVLSSHIPYVITIADLIHLTYPGTFKYAKKAFYEFLIKPSIKKAAKIITVSNYSKEKIMEWANIPADKIINVGNGVSETFSHVGKKYSPGFPYFLYVGNSKEHKNILRLLKAFVRAKIDDQLRLILVTNKTPELQTFLHQNKLENRILFCSPLTESELAEYYRGASALLFPSLYEGFGLPLLEAMSSGIPILASNSTAIPEVTEDAALLIDPHDLDHLTAGIEQISDDPILRIKLIGKGFQRVKLFSWEKTAQSVQKVLDEFA